MGFLTYGRRLLLRRTSFTSARSCGALSASTLTLVCGRRQFFTGLFVIGTTISARTGLTAAPHVGFLTYGRRLLLRRTSFTSARSCCTSRSRLLRRRRKFFTRFLIIGTTICTRTGLTAAPHVGFLTYGRRLLLRRTSFTSARSCCTSRSRLLRRRRKFFTRFLIIGTTICTRTYWAAPRMFPLTTNRWAFFFLLFPLFSCFALPFAFFASFLPRFCSAYMGSIRLSLGCASPFSFSFSFSCLVFLRLGRCRHMIFIRRCRRFLGAGRCLLRHSLILRGRFFFLSCFLLILLRDLLISHRFLRTLRGFLLCNRFLF